MVWAVFHHDGVLALEFITTRMNSLDYQTVLQKNSLPFLQRPAGQGVQLQQGNAPMHVSRSTKAFFQQHQINVMDWPACSPDANPIEILWGLLVRKIYANNRTYDTVASLKAAILQAWNCLDAQLLKILANSLPNRIFAITKTNGGHTDY